MRREIPMNHVRHLAILSEKETGTIKELNVISWNENPPKLDIRDWFPDGRCGKGVTLTDYEARVLCEALHDYLEEG